MRGLETPRESSVRLALRLELKPGIGIEAVPQQHLGRLNIVGLFLTQRGQIRLIPIHDPVDQFLDLLPFSPRKALEVLIEGVGR